MSFQERKKRREPFLNGEGGVNAREASFALVELDEGRGLLVVDFEAVLRGFEGIVGALDELAAAAVADAFLFGRGKELVERHAAFLAGEAGGEALKQEVFGSLEQDHGVELHADPVHGVFEEFGLGDRAREAVEDESVGAFGRGEAGGDHVGDDLVGDELAGLHARFGLLAEFGAGGDFAAEDLAGGDVGELFLRHEGIGEGAFSRAGRAEQDEVLFRNHKSKDS